MEWLDALDHGRLADGPGGEARLTDYRLMSQAYGDFPWSAVVADVRRRDYRSQAARQVYVKAGASAKCAFVPASRVAASTGSRTPLWSCPRTRQVSRAASWLVGVTIAARRGPLLVRPLILLEVGRLTVEVLVGVLPSPLAPVGISRFGRPSGPEWVRLPSWARTGWRSSVTAWSRARRRPAREPLPGCKD